MTIRGTLWVSLAIAIVSSGAAHAEQSEFGPFNAVEDFERDFVPLDEFESVEAFEAQLDAWQAACLAGTGGSSWSGLCFKRTELWDRELNIQYKKLRAALDEAGRKMLTTSQRDWITARDSTIAFDNHTVKFSYSEPGTMWVSIMNDVAEKGRVELLRSRTLVLRDWERRWARGPVTEESLLNE